MPGFQLFFSVLHHFVLAKLVTSSVRVNLHTSVSAFIKLHTIIWTTDSSYATIVQQTDMIAFHPRSAFSYFIHISKHSL